MQIVIDIPEEIYKASQIIDVKYEDVVQIPLEVIAKGTPLPKGHGRLKDIDKIISDGRSKGFCDWYDEMKYAQTIIKTDKTESENMK